MSQKNPKLQSLKAVQFSSYQGSKETAHFLQFKQEYEEFKRFCRNSLLALRKELENVLFSCFLFLLRLGLDRRLSPEEQNDRFRLYRQLIDSNKFFFLSPRLLSDAYKVSQALTFEQFPMGFAENLEKMIGPGKHVVFLSQFSQECLFSFLEFEKLSAIQNSLSSFLNIKLLKDTISESNYKHELLKFYQNEDLEKMSIGTVQTLPNKNEVELYQALDFMAKKRKNNLNLLNKKPGNNKTIQSEIPYFSDNFKGANLPEGSNDLQVPEMKLSSKVQFAQNYLERVPLNEETQPSILQVTVTDQLENMTCIEIGNNCNVFLCGYLDSSIILFSINPDFLELPPKESKENQENGEDLRAGNHIYANFKFLGHSSAITGISLHYDECYFLSSSVDMTMRLWCLRSRSCLSVYQGHINTIWTVRFYSKGYYFATGSSDTTAKLWCLDRVSPLRVFVGHNSDVTVVEFVSNSQFLVSAGLDSRIIFWELTSGTKVRVLFHYQEPISCLSLSPTGLFMVSGSQEGSLILWDLNKFVRINCWELETGEKKQKIAFAGFSADETLLMAGSKKRLGFFVVKSLKERKNVDIYQDFKVDDDEEITDKKLFEEKEELWWFDNQGQECFSQAKFHEKNSVFLVSKSLF